jgi:hypothetical protein
VICYTVNVSVKAGIRGIHPCIHPFLPYPCPWSTGAEQKSLKFVSTGSAIASFWSEERSQKAFPGPGDYRPGWYLLDDDSVELNDPTGWEPLIHEIDRACFEHETATMADVLA